MRNTVDKLISLFCIIVFVTFLVNHGCIDFSAVDWIRKATVEAIKSEEGQQYVEETKEISKNVFKDLFNGLKSFIVGPEEETAKSDKLQEATLLSCVDGDTLKVKVDKSEKTVKLIGISEPDNNVFSEDYASIASDYTKALLEKVKTVYLEYDVNSEDTDGNTLAYVWLSSNPSDPENNMLNAVLVKNGYADDVVYMPNNKYADVFMELRQEASTSNTGLWKNNDVQHAWN